MRVWCFASDSGLWALSGDEKGECLPGELGPWIFVKAAVLDIAHDDERKAQTLIRKHGFCCFDAEVDG